MTQKKTGYTTMFETVCFEHWRRPQPPNEFNMFSCTHDDCAWCELDKFLLDEPTNRRFMRNVKRHVDKLKRDQLPQKRKVFVMSEY